MGSTCVFLVYRSLPILLIKELRVPCVLLSATATCTPSALLLQFSKLLLWHCRSPELQHHINRRSAYS